MKQTIKMYSIHILLFSLSFLLLGCKNDWNYGLILDKANAHDRDIQTIMENGFELCNHDISSAGIELREKDNWSPTQFDSRKKLGKLIDVNIRYVSFYAVNRKFVGILMSLSPEIILYKGANIDNIIILGGSKYSKAQSLGSFSFYIRESKK